ncbi:unnamed protein product [Dibothriocephalus latus]|uniref:PH domain-containing protein n=1 Tax=Dibothriocephalus latus TaxID=60516 RepID=A0A3P7PM86_DIBLA|nr:unnamed protein product [Dibothriocephalus latus]
MGGSYPDMPGFNAKQLGAVSAQWNSTFEGILLIKQKTDALFKRSAPFEEHWCRLKGNLLVILRTDDRTSTDLLGVIILEHCSVSLCSEAGVQHAFKIEFKSGDAPILMAARSAAEAKMWCRHISAAGLSELVALQAHFREELRKRTGTDPLDPLNKPFPRAALVAGMHALTFVSV